MSPVSSQGELALLGFLVQLSARKCGGEAAEQPCSHACDVALLKRPEHVEK